VVVRDLKTTASGLYSRNEFAMMQWTAVETNFGDA
jgi:hypothetical protein